MVMKVQSPQPPPPSLAFKVFGTLAGLLTTAFTAVKPAKLSLGSPAEERGKCQICWLVGFLC